MTLDHINKIRGNFEIYAAKKADNILEGSYHSVFKGRSLNFDDLREYVPGDNIKDIDWKASSRARNLLVKRFIAEKKHNIVLVTDTGRKMSAHSTDLEKKKDIALQAIGTLGYIAAKNGDNVGAFYNDGELLQHYQTKQGFYNLERILTDMDRCMETKTPYGIERPLEYILKNISRRLIIIIVSDIEGMARIDDSVLKQLCVRHDVVCAQVSDANYIGGNPYEVNGESYVPPYIAHNKKLLKMEQKLKNDRNDEIEKKFLRNGVVSVQIDSEQDVTEKLIELMERHKYASRH
ncbi:MAG: DUF58 domain-containing protein [Lachnospiraceae bacterium]|nr:DUF58 domain-containing protein [Candidatus Merdinaster equi]